jgi:hypothetical protein
MMHLTETGYHAGRRLCLTSRDDGEPNAHAAYAPLNRAEFRATACPGCLRVWATEAYDDDDEMPEWVQAERAKD